MRVTFRYKQHHRYGAERSGTADAGRPRQQDYDALSLAVSIMPLRTFAAMYAAELLHAAAKCGEAQ